MTAAEVEGGDENDRGKWWIGNADTDPLHSAENDAPPRCSCGNAFGCLPSACQWEGIDDSRVIPPG